MVNSKTDFFLYKDSFIVHKDIQSIKIFGNPVSSLLTVAIPTYKRTKTLKQAIESAINQKTDVKYNILVIDNNPERDDDTEVLMKDYINYNNISYYKNAENLGMTGNWNRLLQLVSTKWVIMLHDDDILYPEYISTVVNYLSNDVSIVTSRTNFFSESLPRTVDSNENIGTKIIKFHELWKGNPVNIVGVCINKELAIKLGGFNNEFYPTMDSCFWALLAKHKPIIYINRIITGYRVELNESLKKTVLDGFINNEIHLTNQIMKGTAPKWIISCVQINRTMKQEKSIRKVFCKDYENMFFKPSSLLLKITSVISEFYAKYIKLFYT